MQDPTSFEKIPPPQVQQKQAEIRSTEWQNPRRRQPCVHDGAGRRSAHRVVRARVALGVTVSASFSSLAAVFGVRCSREAALAIGYGAQQRPRKAHSRKRREGRASGTADSATVRGQPF